MNKREKGAGGEELAARYLQKLGYKIIERNFTTRMGEIDIVAKDGDCWVFVEVKTRENAFYGLPRESVEKRKQRKYSLLATYYIKQHKLSGQPARFDVVDILGGRITYIPDAFESLV
jgi:putative endonuclease